MEYLHHAAIIGITILGLWFGASWLVISAAHIARKLGLSEVVIGLTIVAIGTSAPEFATSITAALKGQADYALSNVVGSNVFNLGFILGGFALFAACPTGKRMVYRDGSMLILAAGLLAVFLMDSVITWWEGAILAILLVGYVLFLFIQKDTLDEEVPEGDFHWYDIPKIIAGILLIAISAHYLVKSADAVATLLGASEWLIGFTILAAGTSMPELATSVIAAIKGHHGISVGNLVGSDLFNLLGVLGLAAILRPLHVSAAGPVNVLILAGFMIVVVIVMRTKYRITRVEGAILLILAAIRYWLNFA